MDFEDIVGMESEEAKELLFKRKINFRVVEKNGEPCIVSCDWNPTRVNLRINEGIVTSFYMG